MLYFDDKQRENGNTRNVIRNRPTSLSLTMAVRADIYNIAILQDAYATSRHRLDSSCYCSHHRCIGGSRFMSGQDFGTRPEGNRRSR